MLEDVYVMVSIFEVNWTPEVATEGDDGDGWGGGDEVIAAGVETCTLVIGHAKFCCTDCEVLCLIPYEYMYKS